MAHTLRFAHAIQLFLESAGTTRIYCGAMSRLNVVTVFAKRAGATGFHYPSHVGSFSISTTAEHVKVPT